MDAGASARKGREQGERRIEPNLVSTWPRVTNGARCVRQNRVVLTVVATVKPCGRRQRANRLLAVDFSQGDGGQRNSAPGRARHKPSNHSRREGRDVLAALYVAVQLPVALHTHSEPRVPAGARPSLRPRHMRGRNQPQNSGRNGRETANSCPVDQERRLYSRHGCFKEEPGCGAALEGRRGSKFRVNSGTSPQRPGSLNEKDVRP